MKWRKILFPKIIFIFSAILFSLIFLSGKTLAEDSYFFRIDSELDAPLVAGGSGATVTWRCDGSGQGIVTDNTASESGGAVLDGIIKVASTSLENNAAHAGCAATEPITATVSFNGWASRVVTGTVPSVGSNVTFTMRASADYTILVSGVANELGTTLTLDGTTASATYSGTVASQSYRTGKRYIAGSTSGGTIKAGADGYVNRISSALTISSTATQSVDFGTSDNSSLNESGLDYRIVINGIATELGGALTLDGTTASATYSGTIISQVYNGGKRYIAGSTSGGTVTGGANGYVNRTSSALTISKTASQSVDFGTSDNSSFNESGLLFGVKTTVNRETYSPTPVTIAITGATVTAGDSQGISCTDNSDGKYYCAVPLSHTGTAARATNMGSGLSVSTAECAYTDRTTGSDAQSTCTITATEVAHAAIPIAYLSPAPTPLSVASKLFRKANDPKVYVQKSDGLLYWIKTLEDFNTAGYQWKDVQVVSGSAFAQLRIGGNLRVVRGIGYLRIRNLPSLKGTIIGRTFPNEEWDFVSKNDNWYNIVKNGKDVGWIFGGYVGEI